MATNGSASRFTFPMLRRLVTWRLPQWGQKWQKAQNEHMFFRVVHDSHIDRRLRVRHPHADTRGHAHRYASKSVANDDLTFVIWRKDDVYRHELFSCEERCRRSFRESVAEP